MTGHTIKTDRLTGEFDVADTTLNMPHPYELETAVYRIHSHAEKLTNNSEIIFAITLTRINRNKLSFTNPPLPLPDASGRGRGGSDFLPTRPSLRENNKNLRTMTLKAHNTLLGSMGLIPDWKQAEAEAGSEI